MESFPTSYRATRKTWRGLAVLAGILIWGIGVFCLATTPAVARDVQLGGKADNTKKPPPNVVELPIIIVAKRSENGGFQHLQLEAWLAPKDLKQIEILELQKTVISQKAKDAFPDSNFDILKSPRDGSALAKKTIRQATESSLGQPWAGDVLIHNMLVY